MKELTPEWFYLPEFLTNSNSCDLGHLQKVWVGYMRIGVRVRVRIRFRVRVRLRLRAPAQGPGRVYEARSSVGLGLCL